MADREMSDEDLERFRRHMAKLPEASHVCPVCNAVGWGIVGLTGVPNYQSGEPPKLNLTLFYPMVITYCLTCAYVRQYSWPAITQTEGGGGQ